MIRRFIRPTNRVHDVPPRADAADPTGRKPIIEDGRLPLHNNMSELNLRSETVGRKNWLFVGSDEGGEVNARFVSLLASCRLSNVEPWSYLRDLLCPLPRWSDVQKLLRR